MHDVFIHTLRVHREAIDGNGRGVRVPDDFHSEFDVITDESAVFARRVGAPEAAS